jgi:hypothetical protein
MADIKHESVEEFIARGGKIIRVPARRFARRKDKEALSQKELSLIPTELLKKLEKKHG